MKSSLIATLLFTTILLTGCNSDSARVTGIAEQALRQQAAQNEQIAELNREIASASENLVTADAAARREILQAHQSLVEQRDALEQERRRWASERVTESILAPLLWHFGTLLLCSLPVVVALLVLRRHEPDELQSVNEVLIHELVSEQPQLLPRAPVLKQIAADDAASRTEPTS